MEIAKILNQMKVVVTTDLSKKSNGETKYLRTLKLKKKELFVAKDFAELLGYADTHQAIVDNCKKTTNLKLVLNQVYTTVLDKSTVKPYRKALGTKWATTQLIQEPDIWRLIIKSRLPEAEKIESWIMEEVLPSIRKNGFYISKEISDEQVSNLVEEANSIYEERRLFDLEHRRLKSVIYGELKKFGATEKQIGGMFSRMFQNLHIATVGKINKKRNILVLG